MMVFKTSQTKIEKPAYTIEFKNTNMADGHWTSEKRMVTFLEEIEVFLYDKDTFNKKIIIHSLNMIKKNLRVEKIEFYNEKDKNKLIMLAYTNVGKIKEFEPFTREMSISFRKDQFEFSIVEVVAEEVKVLEEKKISLPENWVVNEYLTDRYAKMREYA